ncbi:MAG: oligosaccharide flippase family protein, partial [Clostridia bacterium]
MGRYKKLMSNTVIFAISNFAQRGIGFVLMPLYTSVMTTDGFGTFDVLNNVILLLIPILTLSMSDAILRFSIDSEKGRGEYFSTGMAVVIGSSVFLIACYPILQMVEFMKGYVLVFVLLYFTSALRTYMAQFVRGVGKVMLFAIDGIIMTVVLVGGNLLFLVTLRLGPTGYLISLVLSNVVSIVILSIFGKVWKFFKIKSIKKKAFGELFRYSAPLIPNSISWWATNLFNRYIVIAACSVAINGLFASAARIPSMLMVFSTIFMQAWQLSAVMEYNSKDREKFYTTIYKYFSTFIFVCCSFLLATLTLYSKLLFQKEFSEAWVFVPFLMLGMVFNCLVAFFGSVYISAKKTKMNFYSSFIGAVVTIILCLVLVPLAAKISPEFGAKMAGVATMMGFAVMWVIRIKDTRKYVKIGINYYSTVCNLGLIFVQCIFLSFKLPGYKVVPLVIFILML